MTDNDIIKALERMSGEDPEGFSSDILHLINHQKEMIDGLIAGQETLQAEIERLKEKNESLDALVRSYGDYVTKTRAEAIKEFAEKLNNLILPQLTTSTLEKKEAYYFCLDEIHDLLKEMMGEE